MIHFLTFVPSLLAVFFGCLLVLVALAAERLGVSALVGSGAVILGLAHLTWVVFLAGADGWERQEARPVYWAVLGLMTVAILGSLLAVNSLGSQTRLGYGARIWVWERVGPE